MLVGGNGVCKGPVAGRTHQTPPHTHPLIRCPPLLVLSPARWFYSWSKVRETTKGLWLSLHLGHRGWQEPCLAGLP